MWPSPRRCHSLPHGCVLVGAGHQQARFGGRRRCAGHARTGRAAQVCVWVGGRGGVLLLCCHHAPTLPWIHYIERHCHGGGVGGGGGTLPLAAQLCCPIRCALARFIVAFAPPTPPQTPAARACWRGCAAATTSSSWLSWRRSSGWTVCWLQVRGRWGPGARWQVCRQRSSGAGCWLLGAGGWVNGVPTPGGRRQAAVLAGVRQGLASALAAATSIGSVDQQQRRRRRSGGGSSSGQFHHRLAVSQAPPPARLPAASSQHLVHPRQRAL